MRTYTAELARWTTVPIHENFVECAIRDAERMMQGGRRSHAHETTCPYCGESGEGVLLGTLRVGAKDPREGIPLRSTGYSVPDVGERDTDFQVIHCTNCSAAINPLSYLSPAVFYADKENILLWDDDM